MVYSASWSLAQKIGFRFISSFFILFIAPFSLLFGFYKQFIQFLTQLIASNVLGIDQKLNTAFTGSSDSLYHWASQFTHLLLALLITIIWTVLDRKRPSYRIFSKWFFLFISYYLVIQMFIYGFIKVFHLQFIPINLEQLFQTYGYSSPMRLMWTFMGASHAYNVFAGASEIIAGVLLMFRRTRVLGGVVTFGVMINVFVMNLSYDVPVKLHSLMFMLLALLIALADYRRLLAIFVQNKDEIPTTVYQPIFQVRRNQIILITFQSLLVVALVATQLMTGMAGQKQYGLKRTKPPLYGVYNVTKFVKNGQSIPSLVNDTIRWNRLLIDYPKWVSVMQMDNTFQRYRAKTDTLNKQIILNTRKDTVNKYVMKYERIGKDLKLKGVLKKDTLEIHLKNSPLENFLILSRKFHWINEVPYNNYEPK